MADIIGTVSEYKIKNGTAKTGKPYTLYSVVVDGDYYGNGFDPIVPTPEPGDVVKIRFDEVQNGQYTNRNIKAFRIETKAADNPDKGTSNSGSGGGGNSNSGMAWGNASNVAAQLISQLVLADAIPLSATGGKANKAKRFDEFLDVFDKLRVKLYKDSEDINRVLDLHQDFGEVKEIDPKPLPEGSIDEPDEEDDF